MAVTLSSLWFFVIGAFSLTALSVFYLESRSCRDIPVNIQCKENTSHGERLQLASGKVSDEKIGWGERKEDGISTYEPGPNSIVMQQKSDFEVEVEGRFKALDAAAEQFRSVLDQLDLVDPKNVVSNLSAIQLEDIPIVNAATRDHFDEGMRILCPTLMAYGGYISQNKTKLYFYLLDQDISQPDREKLQQRCPIIIIREFPYNMFPPHIKSAGNYAFKSLVISLMLLEFKAVYWLDTSTKFTNDMSKGKPMQAYLDQMKSKNMAFAQCNPASHSVLATTDQGMFKYLPMEEQTRKVTMMFEAGHLIFLGTKKIKSTVLKRMVQCALVEDCISPPGSQKFCKFGKDRWVEYAGCHRFDQSALAIISQNYFNHDTEKYFLECDQWVTN